MNRKADISFILFILAFIGVTLVVGVLCFGNLGNAATSPWDEARHGVNAYEMYKNNEFFIHTYNYETDYFNYKPPLSFWCIMLSYKLFGVSFFSMRFYAAASMFLIFAAVSIFLFKKYGKAPVLLFGVFLTGAGDLFFTHMGRQADADALFVLFYTIGVLCLFCAKKKPWLVAVCGLAVSGAFMCKCFHVATLLLIGAGVYILNRLYRELKLKHYIAFILCSALPILIWTVIRYRFDGLIFFEGMLGTEVVERVESSSNYLGYIKYIFTSPVYLILIGSALVLFFTQKVLIKKSAGVKPNTMNREDLTVYLLWISVPIIVYSISGAYMQWYLYPAMIPVLMICAILVSCFLKTAWQHKKWLCILAAVPVIFCLLSGFKSISGLKDLVNEGNSGFRRDVYACMEKNADFTGHNAYIENSKNEYLDQNFWEQSQLLEAEFAGDLKCMDGGVPAFMEDPEGVLFISKELFDEYTGALTGRVILLDGEEYLVFCNDFY